MLRRVVLLSGEAKNYVYAESTFVFDRFPRSIQYKVLETDQPIGLLWKSENMETYREVQGYKIELSEAVALHLGIEPKTPILSKSYTINYNKKLMGIITEKMSLNSFGEDA